MIPPIVKNLVAADKNFSDAGFGPISQNSMPFYVGRWLDPVTMRVRLLPPASKKYINPLSWSGQKGYLEASILNKWNKFV